MEFFATNVGIMTTYVDTLAGLEPPSEYAADHERQVLETRVAIELLEATTDAAETGDDARFNELNDELGASPSPDDSVSATAC